MSRFLAPRAAIVFCLGILLAAWTAAAHARDASAVARYDVRMSPGSRRLSVRATIPIAGSALRMDSTRPAGIPELDADGWRGLATGLRVADASGRSLQALPAGENGWTLATPDTGVVRLEYDVDYSLLERRDWPAPREAAYADSGHLALVGRSLFITTDAVGASVVTFELPSGWTPVTAWRPHGGAARFDVASPGELVENLLVLARTAPEDVIAGQFHLHIVALGHWRSGHADVRGVLAPVVRRFVAMLGGGGREDYVVVLLPQLDRGAESYRHSFAMNVEAPVAAGSGGSWGNTVAHEIFHLWNGWRLHGADYAASQWFQEGFTEYAANATLARAGLVEPDAFLAKLATHLDRYRELRTSLENSGTHKGPPLYGGGALVAFSWDVMIRGATANRRTLADFLRELLRRTDGGRREYTWQDIRAALQATAPLDWEAWYEAHIRGAEPLPLDAVLPLAGLRAGRGGGGAARIEEDPAAGKAAKALWRDLLRRD